jgi:catechol 2,3-dioxygenase-like lactoylglutathione lyase family enzyme
VALVTDQYDEMRRFYGEKLGFPVVEAWDRDNARGIRFDINGMRLELLDNKRERRPRWMQPGTNWTSTRRRR